MAEFKIASGRSNLKLAHKVAEKLGIELSPVAIHNFSDGEIWAKYEDNIRGDELFILQSTIAPADNLMELLILIDAAKRASARKVAAVIPYFGYARQDRKDQPRVSITAKLVANLLSRAGADRIITIDLHSSQIQGFFDIPLDHLYASPVLLRAINRLGLKDIAVVSPDLGGAKTARAYAKRIGGELVLVDKRRPVHNKAVILNIIGDIKDKNMLIIDDMIDTGTTFLNCARALRDGGAKSIIGVCVHPVFSGNALENIIACEALTKLFVTDTIPLLAEHPKIEVISVSELLAESIIRTHDNRSISSLFEIAR